MDRKDHIDLFGVASLVLFSALLGLNQVVIKIVNDGLQPVFAAGIRSVGATFVLYLWMKLSGAGLGFRRESAPAGLLAGGLFAFEFILLFTALDFTSVARVSVLFYSMPVWLALMAHVAVPGERIGGAKALGLALAFGGVVLALFDRPGGAEGGLAGDIMAVVAAMSWAGIALVARATPFARVEPVMQLFWQVSVSSVILIPAAFFFGPFVREFTLLHAGGMAFQILGIATGAFLFWFWLLKIYPASGVASFSFLSPIFGVGFGWLILGESVAPSLWAALALVCLGLVLINRPKRSR